MTDTKTKSVKMTFGALYSYVLNTAYRNISGIAGLFLSVASVLILIFGWNSLTLRSRIILIIVALLFLVVNPLMLALKTANQLKTSPSYKKPLEYTFSEKGITVRIEDNKQDIAWDEIYRLMLTSKMVAIYTTPVLAFVIPLSQLENDRGKILTILAQFTSNYNTKISSNLKAYRTGNHK